MAGLHEPLQGLGRFFVGFRCLFDNFDAQSAYRAFRLLTIEDHDAKSACKPPFEKAVQVLIPTPS
jgi:hypothetical protein